MTSASGDEPKIEVEEIYHNRVADPGHWRIQWRFKNHTRQPMTLLSVRTPHGKFNSTEHDFKPPLVIDAGQSSAIVLSVRCREAPAAVIENAFLIFLTEWRDTRWRLFVRLRVTIDQGGELHTVTELITTQRVGFSGVS
jgi:hypothetical protein